VSASLHVDWLAMCPETFSTNSSFITCAKQIQTSKANCEDIWIGAGNIWVTTMHRFFPVVPMIVHILYNAYSLKNNFPEIFTVTIWGLPLTPDQQWHPVVTMKVALRCLLTIAIYAAPSILAKNCTVCRDGSAVPNPDLSLNTTSVPQDNQDLALLPLLIGATCGQVEDFIKSFSSDSSECMNATSSANLDFLCGCPGSVQECFLCSNGTSPGNPDYALPFWNVNCSELDYYLGYLSESTCPVIPIVLNPELSVCGCPGITLSCPLCGDGSLVPDPTLPITDVTCAAAQLLATFSTEECTGLQATAGVLWWGHSISMPSSHCY